MYQPEKLKLYPFDPATFLSDLGSQNNRRIDYIKVYLRDLKATTVLEEPTYFDRDFLSEFTHFYSLSAQGYQNRCRRLHFFKGAQISRTDLETLFSGDKSVHEKFQSDYLGFVVIRPLESTPFGKTVLKWYDDATPQTPRVTEPCRQYNVHIGGLPFSVRGLAWQQQDKGVAACASVSVWSMLHSSAFDDYHSIPTTAEITKSAHKTASLGARIFPAAKGLRIEQLCEAIKEHGFAPLVVNGDIQHNKLSLFSKERFASTCAAFIRSGYPVILAGQLLAGGRLVGGHAICTVGFRDKPATKPEDGKIKPQDGEIQFFYIHDDNLGPNVRWELSEDSELKAAVLMPSAPSGNDKNVFEGYGPFLPSSLIVAVHNELRMDADELHTNGFDITNQFNIALKALSLPEGLNFSARFQRISNYLNAEVGQLLSSTPEVLSQVRLKLLEEVSPMSLHIGLIRISEGQIPVADFLYDTSDSSHKIFANVVYHPLYSLISEKLEELLPVSFGTRVQAYKETTTIPPTNS